MIEMIVRITPQCGHENFQSTCHICRLSQYKTNELLNFLNRSNNLPNLVLVKLESYHDTTANTEVQVSTEVTLQHSKDLQSVSVLALKRAIRSLAEHSWIEAVALIRGAYGLSLVDAQAMFEDLLGYAPWESPRKVNDEP